MSNPGPASSTTLNSQAPFSNVQQMVVLSVSVGTLAAITAATAAEQSVAVSGLATTDVIMGVSKPTVQAGLGIAGYRVSSAGNLGITFVNPTAGSITPTANEVYSVTVMRPAPGQASISAMPIL